MEKNRIAQRKQQFADQFDQLDAEIHELEVAIQAASSPSEPSGLPTGNAPTVSSVGRLQQQQLVRLHYQAAELCGQYQDYKLAAVYYHKVLAWLEARKAPPPPTSKPALTRTKSAIEPPSSVDEESIMATSGLSVNELLLKENVLNNLAVMYFGAGDASPAIGFLLDAKKLVRDTRSAPHDNETIEAESMEITTPSQQQRCLEKTLTANYACFLHTKGHIEDAIHAATSVVEMPPLSGDHDEIDERSDVEMMRAEITALCLLSSCHKAKGDDEPAMAFASQAAQLAVEIQDQTLLSRTHNNLALFLLERREFAAALNHLLTAYRATQNTGDFPQQAVVKYHIGLVISELEVTVKLPQTGRSESSTRHRNLLGPIDLGISEGDEMAEDFSARVHRASTTKAVVVSAAAPPMTSAKDCFVQSENLATALPKQDHALTFLAHGCRGESAYYAGEFHTAEAEFSIALQRLQTILYPEKKDGEPGGPGVEFAELVKVQGHLLSYMGCTQLVEGKFEAAEESHQCDLEMALQHEDIHAQQRAMRNLALVFNTTQRYHEAIPLWREALEIANVLQSKADQMMAYSGLGIAMKELRITDQRRGEFKELLELKENDPLQIFLRQRALALELADKNQQILAQRHIVSVYESPDRPDIEQRLAECDTLVHLCEQYENLQYRADAYRSLANALTAQLARLSARGTRFAEAVSVLTEKRNSICIKYQQATKTLKAAVAVMFKAEEGEAIALKKPHVEDKHARPPISRVDLLQRR